MLLKESGEGDRMIGKSGRNPFTNRSSTGRGITDTLDKAQKSGHRWDTSSTVRQRVSKEERTFTPSS
jgi:hypothetical protein